ncbi:MAG: Smr/MutS family protein [Rickettsiales bacterium]|nr:Smr/MutS family protein [Rickettsiales bacterium]
MSKDKERKVTPKEKALWRFVTRHDTKMHEDDSEGLDIDAYAKNQVKHVEVKPIRHYEPKEEKHMPLPMLSVGTYAGVDRRTASKFKKGKLEIDRTIDLHGLNQLDAIDEVRTAVLEAYEAQQRVLLVITGKGNQGEGVLRQQLPLWLNASSIRPLVLAFDYAIQQHGGNGAFYVLLKRKR